MTGIADFAENEILDAVFNNTSLAVASTWMKLHTGDPGDDGTALPAGETTRKQFAWTGAAGSEVVNEGDVEWDNVSTTETITHWSLWDDETAGNCLWTGEFTDPIDVNAGNSFRVRDGQISVTLD